MPLRFLIDEDTRDEAYLNAIDSHNALHPNESIDAVRVGDQSPGQICPPRGASDWDIIHWASENGRVIVSRDANTLIAAYRQFIANGGSSPGLVVLTSRMSPGQFAEYLCLLAHAIEPGEIESNIRFAPN